MTVTGPGLNRDSNALLVTLTLRMQAQRRLCPLQVAYTYRVRVRVGVKLSGLGLLCAGHGRSLVRLRHIGQP